MLDFLFAIIRLILLGGCLVLLRAASVGQFVRNRIFRTHGVDYYRNNQRKSGFENYLFIGFKNVIPGWLYIFNLGYTALCALIFLLMFIGFAFGAIWLKLLALWLFMYMALLTLITNLLYNIPDKKLVRRWCFFGLYGSVIITLALTAILWSICF